MKEQILQMLKTKFVGVSEITLNRMAEKAAKTITNEEQVQSYVDGVGFQNLIDSEADYRATKATLTSIENYEKKHNIKDGRLVKDETVVVDEPTKTEEVPAWAKGLLDFAKSYQEEKQVSIAKTAKTKLVDKLIELGANKDDKSMLEGLVNLTAINDESEVDEKANGLLTVYNTFKKPSKTETPEPPDAGGTDDDFVKMLKEVKGETTN